MGRYLSGVGMPGNVYAVTPDRKVIIIAKGLYMPNGVAFYNGSLYVAEMNRILRYDGIETNLHNQNNPVIVYDKLPSEAHHGWKYIRFGPDNKLYIPVGMPCNICERKEPYGSMWRLNPDGTDALGDNIPPDELDHAPEIGMDFGFPYCHGKNIPDPKYNKGYNCSEFTPPEVELGPHVAALGMRFYTGKMFPAEYQNQIFIAEHGSTWSSKFTGYRITLVKLDKNRKAISYETFAHGWLQGKSAWGRPVDILIMPDGSMLVSDDRAGAIYQIKYVGK